MENTEKAANKKKKKTIRKVISIVGLILCAIFGFMLTCNLVIIIKGAIHPERPPSVFGTTPMVVLSGSMSGTAEDHIEIGDLIFVGKADPAELETGDVIAFMQGKMIVTHRITEVRTAEDGSVSWVTKGDANNAPDSDLVSEDNLIGIYKTRLPKVGNFALFLQKPLGMILFIGVPVLAFIAYDIIRRQRASNKEKAKAAKLQAELDRLKALAGEETPPKN